MVVTEGEIKNRLTVGRRMLKVQSIQKSSFGWLWWNNSPTGWFNFAESLVVYCSGMHLSLCVPPPTFFLSLLHIYRLVNPHNKRTQQSLKGTLRPSSDWFKCQLKNIGKANTYILSLSFEEVS